MVVLLMLIPLLAPSNGAPTGFSTIARALGIAALKARTQLLSGASSCNAVQAVRCWKGMTRETVLTHLGLYLSAEAVKHDAGG